MKIKIKLIHSYLLCLDQSIPLLVLIVIFIYFHLFVLLLNWLLIIIYFDFYIYFKKREEKMTFQKDSSYCLLISQNKFE